MPVQVTKHGWVLETRNTAYAFGLNQGGLLTHTYHGKRLPFVNDYPAVPDEREWASFNGSAQLTPEEYPAYGAGYGGAKYIDPCLKVTFADGVRDVVLRYQASELNGETLSIQLHDEHYPLQVTLDYIVHPDFDLIERRVQVTNTGHEPVTLERIWSAQWHLPLGDDYRLTHLTGRWLDEMHLKRETLVQGVKVLESRRLTTSHHHNPWFAVDHGNADEMTGEVWFGILAWSGNWKLAAEVTDFQSTRINIGLNDWDFAWQLEPGETFTTPSSFGGYTPNGFGAASRILHDFIRDTIIPHGKTTHKILYNSWEATFFDVDEPSQIQLAEIAAEMGIELFVMDDGWFQGRNDDHAGLGDWWADPAKFPNGLNPLIERVNALGMDFGLWIEPEMVNPNSDLYRAHPDWVIHFPTRARTEARNQLILNFARADVQAYIIEHIDRLLSDHHIGFIKWDMNRNVSEPGWQEAGDKQRELWVRYVYGLYHVWGTLRERHPDVIWQSCSGGGGRADAAILK
ncbi:MAG TPA: alpha-galactosidase, partial [Phototrophicaceae bacterium]|nr:alpha-galactosidase [Phototrophicaceae bacterium]